MVHKNFCQEVWGKPLWSTVKLCLHLTKWKKKKEEVRQEQTSHQLYFSIGSSADQLDFFKIFQLHLQLPQLTHSLLIYSINGHTHKHTHTKERNTLSESKFCLTDLDKKWNNNTFFRVCHMTSFRTCTYIGSERPLCFCFSSGQGSSSHSPVHSQNPVQDNSED